MGKVLLFAILCAAAHAQQQKCPCPPRVIDLCTAQWHRTANPAVRLMGDRQLAAPVSTGSATGVPFWVDLAEPRTTLAPPFVEGLRYVRVPSAKSKGKERYSAVTLPAVSIGRQVWTYPRLLVDEERKFGKAGGKDVGGVIGADLLKQTDFLLNFKDRKLTFFFTHDRIIATIIGVRLKPLRVRRNSLAIEGKAGDKTVLVFVSTAATVAEFNAAAVELASGATTLGIALGDLSVQVPLAPANEQRFERLRLKEPAVVLPATLLKDKLLHFSPQVQTAYIGDGSSCRQPARR